jgi:hypothetical protein
VSSFDRRWTIGRIEIGINVRLRVWGFGFCVFFEKFMKSAWIDLGPVSFFVEEA